MRTNTAKVISIGLMVLLTLSCVKNILSLYSTKFSLASPLIPDYVVNDFIEPYFTMVVFTAAGTFIAFLFFLKSKYELSIGTCIAVLLIQPFL